MVLSHLQLLIKPKAMAIGYWAPQSFRTHLGRRKQWQRNGKIFGNAAAFPCAFSGHPYIVNNSFNVDGDVTILPMKEIIKNKHKKYLWGRRSSPKNDTTEDDVYTENYGLPLNFPISRVLNVGLEIETRLFKPPGDFLEN